MTETKKEPKLFLALIMIAAIIMLVGVAAYYSHGLGMMKTCKKSGGILLADKRCVNMSSLGYCKVGGKVYKDESLAAMIEGIKIDLNNTENVIR